MCHGVSVFSEICESYTRKSLVSSEFVFVSTRNPLKDIFLRTMPIGME